MAESYGERKEGTVRVKDAPVASDRSTAELMRELSDQTVTLVRQELELAKAELAAKGEKAGVGAGTFGRAPFVGIVGVGSFVGRAIPAGSTATAGWRWWCPDRCVTRSAAARR